MPRHPGYVYLIHLDEPIAHARHYLGWVYRDVEGRLRLHRSGHGSRILAVANERNIGYQVVRTWIGDRTFERKLKNRKHSPRLCPICKKKH